ncbi:unnamed protein product [Lactuca saligna]|uniref:GRF-type domain-containing protein n=1 Tax=Lactuca saligna TaxID=75948 RepID=A0AA35Z638_LACSI|nr:unnamed protein product [Lactuca saligna]
MVICTCGSVTVRVTYWTDLNPGRRFWSCARNGRSCPFLGWVDDPMCHRVVEVIPSLLRRMNNVQMLLIQARADVVKLKWMLILSWNIGMEWKELCPFIKDWNGMRKIEDQNPISKQWNGMCFGHLSNNGME